MEDLQLCDFGEHYILAHTGNIMMGIQEPSCLHNIYSVFLGLDWLARGGILRLRYIPSYYKKMFTQIV